eukprot:9625934-Lingulodinium_polyedra.AAC.1
MVLETLGLAEQVPTILREGAPAPRSGPPHTGHLATTRPSLSQAVGSTARRVPVARLWALCAHHVP